MNFTENSKILDFYKKKEDKESIVKSTYNYLDNLNESTNFETMNDFFKNIKLDNITLNKREVSNKITNYFDENIIENKNFNEKRKISIEKEKNFKDHRIDTFYINNRKLQKSKLFKWNKIVIIKIMQFLNLSNLFKLGLTCYKFYNICKSVYKSNKYFEKVEIHNYKPGELRKILKSKRIYFDLIKNIIKAKNIHSYFSKTNIYFELKLFEQEKIKNKEYFKLFSVYPKKNIASYGIDNESLKIIVHNSTKSLECLILKNCDLLRNWKLITLLKNLKKLVWDNNYYFDEDDLEDILESNNNLSYLSISNCFKLSFRTISIISLYGKNLEYLDISYNTIINTSATFSTLSNLKNLKYLNVSGLKKFNERHLKEILINLNNLEILFLNYLSELNLENFITNSANLNNKIKSIHIKGYIFSDRILQYFQKYYPNLLVHT